MSFCIGCLDSMFELRFIRNIGFGEVVVLKVVVSLVGFKGVLEMLCICVLIVFMLFVWIVLNFR